MPRRRDFRIGVLGSGFIVNDCHLVAYRRAGFNPVVIASRTPERAAEAARRHGLPKVGANFDELLDDPTIEILDIAASQVKIGIRAPKSVTVLRGEVQLTQQQNRAASQLAPSAAMSLLPESLKNSRPKPISAL